MNRRAMCYLTRLFSSLLLAAGIIVSLAACSPQTGSQPEPVPLEGAAIGGDFTLVDKDAKPVSWANFRGKYSIFYFGYTFCPDACPLDVQAMMQGFAQFEKARPDLASKVQPVFVSIDPQRDTPMRVGEFASAFSPRLMGLTGTAEQVDQAAKAFVAYYTRGEETGGGYLMDHSRVAYLMAPDGAPMALLPIDDSPEAVAAELEKWVK